MSIYRNFSLTNVGNSHEDKNCCINFTTCRQHYSECFFFILAVRINWRYIWVLLICLNWSFVNCFRSIKTLKFVQNVMIDDRTTVNIYSENLMATSNGNLVVRKGKLRTQSCKSFYNVTPNMIYCFNFYVWKNI